MSIERVAERLAAAKRKQSKLTPRAGAWWLLDARVSYLTKALAAAQLEPTQTYSPLDPNEPEPYKPGSA